MRRLYDIANVLSTINLITKVTDPSYRGPRPAFQYIGPRTEIIHHAESKNWLIDRSISNNFITLDVVDFINSENTKSNSKHSLFDHFKRNLFLNCTIPRFDPRNGLLGLKSALDSNGRSSSGVTVTGVYSTNLPDEHQHSTSSESSSIGDSTKKRKTSKQIEFDDGDVPLNHPWSNPDESLTKVSQRRRSNPSQTTKRPVGRPPKKAKFNAEPLMVAPSESNSLIETTPSSPSPSLIKRHPKDLQDINVDMLTYQMRSVLPSISNAMALTTNSSYFKEEDEEDDEEEDDDDFPPSLLSSTSHRINDYFSSNSDLIESNPLPSINSFMNKNYLL